LFCPVAAGFGAQFAHAFVAGVLSYLVGSISAAILVCRALGLPDPRSDGSGNPGATNVLRLGGKKAAALTLAGDLAKGLLPVALANALSDNTVLIAMAGLGALLGHLYPVFFDFKGGKGVATAFGVMFGLHPLAGIVAALCWGLIAAIGRMSSLAAIVTFTLLPLYWFWQQERTYAAHRSNIDRLLSGTEPKIGEREQV